MTINVTITPISKEDTYSLAKTWLELEACAKPSVFLSWGWIYNWLSTVNKPLILVKATQRNTIVGLGILVESYRNVFGVYPVKQWNLHRCGDVKSDQMWVEYNTFLVSSNEVLHAITQKINQLSLCKEVVLGMSEQGTLNEFYKYYPLHRSLIESTGYLTHFKQNNGDWEKSTFSKNTRQKIQKNIREFSLLGELSFTIIKEPSDIQRCMPEIELLHRSRWDDTTTPSGFTNPVFQKFISGLINDAHIVQLAKLSINGESLGYLMHFIYNNNVYFYLSAINRDFNRALNIGLVIHFFSMKYYANKNYELYDFLLGDYRFKKSLSNTSYQQYMLSFAQPNCALWLEHKLRMLKQKL